MCIDCATRSNKITNVLAVHILQYFEVVDYYTRPVCPCFGPACHIYYDANSIIRLSSGLSSHRHVLFQRYRQEIPPTHNRTCCRNCGCTRGSGGHYPFWRLLLSVRPSGVGRVRVFRDSVSCRLRYKFIYLKLVSQLAFFFLVLYVSSFGSPAKLRGRCYR
jgi:hypothetical protein